MSYATVAQLRGYLPQIPLYGQQTITAAASTFTLTYDGAATGSIASGATATAVQTALRAITAIGGSGVKVAGPPGGPWRADFQGDLATNAALLVGSGATVAPATDALLQACLDRATDIVRQALRAALADPSFDWTAYASAASRIVRGESGAYLRVPPHQAGSVSLVEYESGWNPATYAALPDQWMEEDGYLYRAGRWSPGQRYRVTAVWGYGPTAPESAQQLVLELAVNIWRSRDKGGFTEIVGVEGSGGIRQIAGLNKQQVMVVESIRNQLIQVAI